MTNSKTETAPAGTVQRLRTTNAEFIVRAVNNHDDLLAALVAMRKAYRRATGDTNKERIAMEDADVQADAAIAAATKGG